MTRFDEIAEYQKEYKRLSKKYPSLEKDIDIFKKVIDTKIESRTLIVTTKNWAIVRSAEVVSIIKTRLACRYLRGESLRIVFAYHPANQVICFLELYYKGDKENEDRQRYEDYVQSCLKIQ